MKEITHPLLFLGSEYQKQVQLTIDISACCSNVLCDVKITSVYC